LSGKPRSTGVNSPQSRKIAWLKVYFMKIGTVFDFYQIAGLEQTLS
jgi:hypothetical protein